MEVGLSNFFLNHPPSLYLTFLSFILFIYFFIYFFFFFFLYCKFLSSAHTYVYEHDIKLNKCHTQPPKEIFEYQIRIQYM